MYDGYLEVTLRKADSVDNTVLYVIEGHGETLHGRDSSFKLGILKQVNSVGSSQSNRQSELVSLLDEFDNMFHGLRRVTNFEHKIVIDPKVQPEVSNQGVFRTAKLKLSIMSLIKSSRQMSLKRLRSQPLGFDIRPCCDLREVNKAVIRERYVLLKVDDTLQARHGFRYLVKIDTKKGFFS